MTGADRGIRNLSIIGVGASDLARRDDDACTEISNAISAAFGPEGPGILTVRDLEPWYAESRARLLSCGRAFAQLPTHVQAQYECAESDYGVGWSRGREQFRGRVDTSKGSYYANPVIDNPSDGNEALKRAHPFLMTSNIWPTAESSVGANMEIPFKRIGQYMLRLAMDIAWHCDRFVAHTLSKGTGAVQDFHVLSSALANSRTHKGRLLHYYPVGIQPQSPSTALGSDGEQTWCGYHNDHGLLTGLVAAQYHDDAAVQVVQKCPDAAAGLYVVPDGHAQPSHVRYEPDVLAFQLGETAQLLTGGILRATSHAVRAPGKEYCSSLSRTTMAVFFQPDPEYKIQIPASQNISTVLSTSSMVPPLSDRFCVGDSFASFVTKTTRMYMA